MAECTHVSPFGAPMPFGCTPPGDAPAGSFQGNPLVAPPQQLSVDEVFGLIGKGIGLFVQVAGGLVQIINQDSAGNLMTADGQTLPPTTPISVDTSGNGNGNGEWFKDPMYLGAVAIGGIILLSVVLRR